VQNTKYQKKTDIELVELTLENLENYKYIIERYQTKLNSYLKRLLYTSSADVEDVLQDTFIKIYKNLNSYKPSHKFSSWAYRIAHNEAISYLRSKKLSVNELSNDIETDIFELIASDVNIEKEAIKECNSKQFREIFNQLDEKSREILELKFVEEFDYSEISEILQIPSGTVGSLINRAKIKFKELFIENEKTKANK
jgi:RNA polymerase sigma-70 factor (ECF subfamily)